MRGKKREKGTIWRVTVVPGFGTNAATAPTRARALRTFGAVAAPCREQSDTIPSLITEGGAQNVTGSGQFLTRFGTARGTAPHGPAGWIRLRCIRCIRFTHRDSFH